MPEWLRPLYHFAPVQGFMNDPNGLIYYQGEYHLFYQYLWPRHWGHAVSTDLLHWQHLPIALAPDALGDIWSGCVVLDREDSSGFFAGGEGLVAIFTHQNPQQEAPLGPQIQSIAYSHDRGRSWTMYEGNPVIANPGVRDFRDPHVFWHAPTRAWIMVVTYNGDSVLIYRSLNLKEWTLASEFGREEGSGVWECPNLLELPLEDASGQTRWLLHISLYHDKALSNFQHDMRYFLGSFDGYTFQSETPPGTVLRSDYGKDNYAAVSWSNSPDGRTLWIGWLNNWAYAGKLPTGEWQGMMTLPRSLHLKAFAQGIRLVQQPIAELEQLRTQEFRLADVVVSADAPLVLPVEMVAGEISMAFQRSSTAREFGVYVRKGELQRTVVGYRVEVDEVFVDRTLAGEGAFHSGFAAEQRAQLFSQSETLTLRVFLDSSSIEVFVNEGEVVISSLIFPDAASSQLVLFASDNEVHIKSLEVYPYTSIE